jgi:methyl coenzyme M reductase subunit C-like uncharacterized protein (methanogenesis marker protein 7)
MNERIDELISRIGVNDNIIELAKQAGCKIDTLGYGEGNLEKFAELIVKEMCGMMEQAEDDAYHCFEPSERPTEYIEWLRDWQERFTKHFGVE